MITKTFKEDDEKRRKGLRWSLDAAGINIKSGHDMTIIASFDDVYQLQAWATVHREYYGWMPTEADPVLSESE